MKHNFFLAIGSVKGSAHVDVDSLWTDGILFQLNMGEPLASTRAVCQTTLDAGFDNPALTS